METIIRSENPGDERVIHGLIGSAFPTDQEAQLVDRLRANDRLIISLVAEVEDTIVGHIAFSPVTIKAAKTSLWGVKNVYGVDEPFMAMALRPDSIQPGLALYAPEFATLTS